MMSSLNSGIFEHGIFEYAMLFLSWNIGLCLFIFYLVSVLLSVRESLLGVLCRQWFLWLCWARSIGPGTRYLTGIIYPTAAGGGGDSSGQRKHYKVRTPGRLRRKSVRLLISES